MLNKKSTSLWLLVCFWMCVLASAPASAQEQPQTQPGDPPKAPFVRQGIYDKPFMIKGFGTSVGGYGDIHWRFLRTEGVTDSLTFSPERFNLFTYTPVGDRVRVALELEIEEGGQEIKLELAIIDFEIHEALTFRAGMLLSPIGRFNLAHDSPANPLTLRPLVSESLIGVTLSEAGMGFFGALYPWRGARITYELYAVNGFTDGVLNQSDEGTRLPAGRANFNDSDQRPSVVGRLAFSPHRTVDLGISSHYGPYNRAQAQGLVLDTRRYIGVYAVDWEVNWWIFQAQGEYAYVSVGVPQGMRDLFAQDQQGVYAQINARFLDGFFDALPTSSFAIATRLDWVDFDMDIDGDSQTRITTGLNFRPQAETVFKLDYHYNWIYDRINIQRPAAGLNFSVASYF
jgi:hypothetical protein